MNYGKNYDAWNIDAKDFPVKGTIEEKIAFFVRYGILAPSTHNIQPWKFEVKKNVLSIFPDWNYYLPQTDPTNRGLFVSLGACTTNIVVAASHFQYIATVAYHGKTQKDFSIQLTFKKLVIEDTTLSALFQFICKRYSNKLSYTPQRIDREIIKQLQSIQVGDAHVKIINDQFIIAKIASYHKKALFEIMTPRIFRSEIAKWLRYNNTQEYDGMPGFVVGMPQFLSVIAKSLFAVLPIFPKKMAEKDYELLKGSPAVGVITTKKSDIISLVDIGRTYELLALQAIGSSLNTTPMAALIENKKYTPLVAEAFAMEGKKLQFFFRLGYSDNRPYHTPRIPLEQVLK